MYKTQIQELIGVIKSLSLPFFHGKLIAFVDKYMGGWDGRLKTPYKEELEVITHCVQALARTFSSH
jgi:hypothetical protein